MSGRDVLCEQALATNELLRRRVSELEARERKAEREHRATVAKLTERSSEARTRREQQRAARAERKLAEAVASPWVELPYIGVVPRHVGPGDPLRKLRGKRTSTLEGLRHD